MLNLKKSIPILHVITTINRGGAENQLLVLAKYQIQNGRKVCIIFLKGNSELESQFLEIGATVINFIANKALAYQLNFLRNFFKTNDVIVHAHLPRAELLSALSIKNQDFFVTRHNTEPFFPKAPKILSSLLSKFVTSRAKRVIAISNAVLYFLTQNNEVKDPKKIKTIYYGYECKIDRKLAKEKSQLRNKGQYVIGTIARIDHQKDFPSLLNTVFVFKKVYPNVKLIVVGDGPLKIEMQRMAKSLDLIQNIEWAGRTHDIFEKLSLFDTFILTSTYEGFGMVLLEAMDSGTPIVASNVSAIPEVLGVNFPGLATTGNPQEFACKLSEMLDEQMRSDVLKIQEERLAKFTVKKMGKSVDDIYMSK